VAKDLCWELPPDVRNAMTLEDKLAAGCNCMGVDMLKEESCNHPGLGKFAIPSVNEPLPTEPAPLPPEPIRPEEPQNQSDNVAMADFFSKLKEYEVQVEEYKRQVETYQAERVAYETARAELQVAVAPAEGVVRNFYNGVGFMYVDKENSAAYISKIVYTWSVQGVIILILFVAILFLQKRKDVI
jgi:hypothetical protein